MKVSASTTGSQALHRDALTQRAVAGVEASVLTIDADLPRGLTGNSPSDSREALPLPALTSATKLREGNIQTDILQDQSIPR